MYFFIDLTEGGNDNAEGRAYASSTSRSEITTTTVATMHLILPF